MGKGKARTPKVKCCVDKPRCKSCPIRMLKDGTLPDGYTVRKRRLVTLDGTPVTKKQAKRAA
ncbi:hypothetical protein [Nocardioides marmoraquaticus]